jgi:hypothetical protein
MTVGERLERTRMVLKRHYEWLIGFYGIPWCPVCGRCPEQWALDEIDHRYSDRSLLPGRVAPSNHQMICYPCNSAKEDRNDDRDYRSPSFKKSLLELESMILSSLPDYSGTELKHSPEQIHEAAKRAVEEQRRSMTYGAVP